MLVTPSGGGIDQHISHKPCSQSSETIPQALLTIRSCTADSIKPYHARPCLFPTYHTAQNLGPSHQARRLRLPRSHNIHATPRCTPADPRISSYPDPPLRRRTFGEAFMPDKKRVRFALPKDCQYKMVLQEPLNGILKKTTARPSSSGPGSSGSRDAQVVRRKEPSKRSSGGSSDQGHYELRTDKRTEYYGDRKVTKVKRTYSYWA